MSAEFFEVIEHVIPAQHIREYAGGVHDEDTVLQMVVREYRPRNNPNPGPDSVTLIIAPGNSDPGQCYEPVWDDLVRSSKVKIRAIWAADFVNRGSSYVLNEYALGDDPSAWDDCRDLLCMINHFRHQIRRPIVGIGHSSGTKILIHLAVMHARLFHSIALVEPAFQTVPARYLSFPLSISRRRDLWPSMAEAEKWFRDSPTLSTYEPRMFDAYMNCMFRETPTAAYPSGTAAPGSVTLKTPKAQELWAFGRPNFTERSEGPRNRSDRLLMPGLSDVATKYPYMGAESHQSYRDLEELRPGVLLVFGGASPLNTPPVRAERLRKIGTGIWGSGGAECGLVKQVVIDDADHILPQQKPTETAQAIADWLPGELQRYKDEAELLRAHKPDKSRRNGSVISESMLQNMTPAMFQERPIKVDSKQSKL